MKPYTNSHLLTENQENFNYCSSRARSNIKCAFGILVYQWRILDRLLAINLLTSEKIIVANFIISEDLIK